VHDIAGGHDIIDPMPRFFGATDLIGRDLFEKWHHLTSSMSAAMFEPPLTRTPPEYVDRRRFAFVGRNHGLTALRSTISDRLGPTPAVSHRENAVRCVRFLGLARKARGPKAAYYARILSPFTSHGAVDRFHVDVAAAMVSSARFCETDAICPASRLLGATDLIGRDKVLHGCHELHLSFHRQWKSLASAKDSLTHTRTLVGG